MLLQHDYDTNAAARATERARVRGETTADDRRMRVGDVEKVMPAGGLQTRQAELDHVPEEIIEIDEDGIVHAIGLRYAWVCPRCHARVETETQELPDTRCPAGCVSNEEPWGLHLRPWAPEPPPPPDPDHILALRQLPLSVQVWLSETASRLHLDALNARPGAPFSSTYDVLVEMGRLAIVYADEQMAVCKDGRPVEHAFSDMLERVFAPEDERSRQ